MIDWIAVLFNALWVIGLSLALSIFSIAYYQSQQQKVPLSTLLGARWASIGLDGAGLLFCVGLVGSRQVLWQQVIWALLAAYFGWNIWLSWTGTVNGKN